MNIVTESMNMDHHINWGKRSITLQNGEVQIKNGVIAHVGAQNSDEVTNANGNSKYYYQRPPQLNNVPNSKYDRTRNVNGPTLNNVNKRNRAQANGSAKQIPFLGRK